jgi:uncharacterized protein YdhG (YjbR/CyaY superfamily)
MSRVRRSKGVSDRPKGAARTAAGPKGLTEEEKAAMKELVQERRGGGTGGEEAVLAKIAEMNEEDRAIARRIHEIITANAPALSPRTWYGMPAYSDSAGDVVCFFQPAQKFKARYATLGFSDKAKLDDGNMWPTAFAIKALTSAEVAKVTALVKRAVAGDDRSQPTGKAGA